MFLRKGTIAFIGLVIITVIARSIIPLAKGDQTSLPYNAWIPYNLENRIFFWLTFTFQSVGAMITGQVIVAGDAFVIVMMLQLCVQIEILIHRIEDFPELCKKQLINNSANEQIILGNWIQHHNSLYL